MKKQTLLAVPLTLAGQSLAWAQDETTDLLSGDGLMNAAQDQVMPWAMNIVGAIVALFFGWIIAGWLGRLVRKGGEKRNLDQTLTKFFSNIIRYVVLTAVLLSVLSVFGIETTSFAAILGAAGLAIGLAFEGTLANFASGVMLLVFRPFKVGDFVEAGGTTGTVEEIELFTTVFKTLDRQKIIVPNKKIFGDTIRNVGAYDTRRVDIDVGCDYSADIDETRAALEECLNLITKKIDDPDPQIFLKGLGGSSVDWQVRVWCKTEDYWDVWQETIRAIKMTLDQKGIGIPFPQMDVHLDESAVQAIARK